VVEVAQATVVGPQVLAAAVDKVATAVAVVTQAGVAIQGAALAEVTPAAVKAVVQVGARVVRVVVRALVAVGLKAADPRAADTKVVLSKPAARRSLPMGCMTRPG
jgi:hypothetical protein